MAAQTSSAPHFTLFDLQRPELIAAPWAYYARLRRESPVHFDPYLRSWLLSRHADVHAVLGDVRFSVEMHHEERLQRIVEPEPTLRAAMLFLDRHVSFVDPPHHGRIRRSVSASFRAGDMRRMEGDVRAIVSEAVAELRRAGTTDAVSQFASPVPLRVLQRLLGCEHVALETLRRWSLAWGDVVAAPGHLPTGDRRSLLATVDELVTALQALVIAPRAGTATAQLVAAAAAGRLSPEELIANLMMLVTAGNETTTNLISNAVLALMQDPSLWHRLREQRTLLAAAVEELARVHPPTHYTARTALEDVDIGGVRIEQGQAVVLLLAAANRDPDVFEAPDEIRIDRPNTRRHVSFGAGAHFCFGAPLARLECRVALDALLDGPQLRLAGPPRWRSNANLRGLASLPVTPV